MTTEDDHPSSSCGRTHRFLSLPAVRPCTDTVSAPSLLRAVLAIVQEITHAQSPSNKEALSRRFPMRSCQRGARRAVHISRLLLPFLEELRCGEHDSNVLLPALSELYVAFQKLRELLHDCALRGARILLLVNSHRVAREFRAFHESVATTVDSLALHLHVDSEVAELAELAGKQAHRAARDAVAVADPADDSAGTDVRSILARLERGVNPRRSMLRRVLDHLGIQTWADCNAEVVFLDNQIELAAGSNDIAGSSPKSQLDMMHGIRGLMLYARVVLFDAAAQVTHASSSRCDGRSPSAPTTQLSWVDPGLLRCPISFDLMMDPVIVSTGQTYSRVSIARWCRDGKRTCPVTGNYLRGASEEELVPNLAVRNVIRLFCQAHHIKVTIQPDAEGKGRQAASPRNVANNKAEAGAMRLVAAHVVRQLSVGPADAKASAVREARLLTTKSGTPARSDLTDAGAVPWLLDLLASSDRRIQDDAAATILNLSKHPDGRREAFQASGLVSLVDLLVDDAGTPDSRANAAGALFYLVSDNKEYVLATREAARAAQGLVDLLKTGTQRGKKHALKAILALLASPANHIPMITAGAVPVLIGLLASESDDIVADAVAAVAAMVERPQGTRAVLAEPSQVRRLVAVLGSGAPTVAKQCCLSALTALCKNGGSEAIGHLNRVPTIMTSLYSLLTESSPAASKLSSSLIRIIHHGFGTADDHLRFRASIASQSSPTSTSQLTPRSNRVHVR